VITNHWELTVEHNKKIMVQKSGQLTTTDKFRALVDPNTPETEPLTRVNIGVSESMEYGSLKVSASITLTCNQNEKKINEAGGLAFFKAVELVTDGFKQYGVELGQRPKE